MTQRPNLEPCPFCSKTPQLVDHRLVWSVLCQCGACILGERAPELQSEEDAATVDWDYYRNSAVKAWNNRPPSPGEQHWRNNHASVVAKSRILIERLDMPVERVQAFKQIEHLEDEIRSLKEKLSKHEKHSR